MNILKVILGVIYLVISLFLIIIVLMQESKQQGISVITGESESFFGKNKGSSREARLARYTITGSVFFGVIAVILGVLLRIS